MAGHVVRWFQIPGAQLRVRQSTATLELTVSGALGTKVREEGEGRACALPRRAVTRRGRREVLPGLAGAAAQRQYSGLRTRKRRGHASETAGRPVRQSIQGRGGWSHTGVARRPGPGSFTALPAAGLRFPGACKQVRSLRAGVTPSESHWTRIRPGPVRNRQCPCVRRWA